MPATLELKYFNSFWIKKLDTIVDVTDGFADYVNISNLDIELTGAIGQPAVGQVLQNTEVGGQPFTNEVYITAVNGNIVTVNEAPDPTPVLGDTISFGPIEDFTFIPGAYDSTQVSDWYVEESRVRGGFNNTDVDLGVKAYIVEDDNKQNHRFNSMIYSGIFNSRTGVNNTNQFSVGEEITRSLDPVNGSIQKLYAEDTNLIIFQESKISNALIDKDAIYSAEGQPLTTSGNLVIGQIRAYAGNYGISTNPESFAVYGYRKYFTDRVQNVVLRLSGNGLEEISNYGMIDYFRDLLSEVKDDGKIIGGWDQHNKQYTISLQPLNGSQTNKATPPDTLVFDDKINGWVSRYSYIPDVAFSLRNNFYTYKAEAASLDNSNQLWKHYEGIRGSFYGEIYSSEITTILNQDPATTKSFKTIDYEGDSGWEAKANTNSDTAAQVTVAEDFYSNLFSMENSLFVNNFKLKENTYTANLLNISTAGSGEILFGQDLSGIKGYYLECLITLDNSSYPLSEKKIFMVGSSTSRTNGYQ
jgi:hypothetical protein